MKRIKIIAAVVLGGLLLASGGCGKSSGEPENIEGKWVGSGPNGQYEITVTGDKFEFRGAKEAESFSGNIAIIYTEMQPGTMDVTLSEPPQLAGKTALFLIERKGDELKLAWAPPGSYRRPSSFNPEPDVNVVTFKAQ